MASKPDQPTPPDDPFDLLGVEARFAIDPADVERRWLAHSAALHPDRASDPFEAAERLARINRARTQILDPEARANALLVRLLGPSKEEDRSLPDGFLMDIMEIRERAEAAAENHDPAARAEVEAWAKSERAAYASRVGRMLDELAATPSDKLRTEIRTELNAWRYIERMLEQIGAS